jgi:hypothetical protein
MLSCKQASRLLSQSLDRKLSWKERLELRFHLFICEMCTRFAEQLKVMQKAMQDWVNAYEQDESIQLSQEARARIAEKIASRH